MKKDPVEEAMFKEVDEKDDALQKQIDDMNEKAQKEGFFGRLMEWNSGSFIAIALVASLFVGASQPIFGGFLMSPVLTQLSVDLDLYAILFPGLDLETEMSIYCAWMGVFAVVTFISMFVQKYFFNRLSE